MDSSAIELEIRRFLTENFPLSAGGFTLGGGDSLLEAGVIDSTGVLELIGFIEERYEVEIADEEVLPENLDSIARITRFVDRKLETAGVRALAGCPLHASPAQRQEGRRRCGSTISAWRCGRSRSRSSAGSPCSDIGSRPKSSRTPGSW